MTRGRFSVVYSTRIWNFRTDDIRLSAFSNSQFLSFIRERFSFEHAALSPPQYPGAEPRYISPPGVALEYGMAPISFDSQGDPEDFVAVRAMGIDANNIAIEVAGSTHYADSLYTQFRGLLGDATTPEGYPYIGKHRSIQDFSMISISGVPGSAQKISSPSLYNALKAHFGIPGEEQVMVDLTFAIEGQDASPIWSIKPRFGTSAADGVLESRAWLSSDAHLTLLQDIEDFSTPSNLAIEAKNNS